MFIGHLPAGYLLICTTPITALGEGLPLMLVAHLVPGYFAAVWSRPYWNLQWSRNQRVGLWIAAFGSTVAPDMDVVYNMVFRGFFGHATLWTHSIFVHLGIVLGWLLLCCIGRLPYLQMLVGLVVIGGLSHLFLDVISHSTPLFYPFSLRMIGAPSTRVLEGKLWGYLTDPIFLLEPLLLGLAAAHWTLTNRKATPRIKRIALVGLVSGIALISGAFLLLLPALQRIAGT